MIETRAAFLARTTEQETKGKTQLKSATGPGNRGQCYPTYRSNTALGYLATTTSDQKQCPSSKVEMIRLRILPLNMNSMGKYHWEQFPYTEPNLPPRSKQPHTNRCPAAETQGEIHLSTTLLIH